MRRVAFLLLLMVIAGAFGTVSAKRRIRHHSKSKKNHCVMPNGDTKEVKNEKECAAVGGKWVRG